MSWGCSGMLGSWSCRGDAVECRGRGHAVWDAVEYRGRGHAVGDAAECRDRDHAMGMQWNVGVVIMSWGCSGMSGS